MTMRSVPPLKQEIIQKLFGRWHLGIAFFFPWVFIFALPPLQMGVWADSEGVAYAIASLGSLAGFVLLAQNFYSSYSFKVSPQESTSRNKSQTQNLFKLETIKTNPLLFSIMGLAILSVILLPFSFDYQLSWFGHPEQFIGGWVWVSLSMILLCFRWLRENDLDPVHRQVLKISIIGACLVQIVLVLLGHPKYASLFVHWNIYHFTAHLAWVGLALIIVSLSFHGWASYLLKGLALFTILLSQNKIAIGGGALGFVIYMAITKVLESGKRWVALCSILLISPICLAFAEYAAFSFGIFPSLGSRFISLKVLMGDFYQAPFTHLLTGMGWGQMSDGIIRQLPTLKTSSLHEATWEGIGRYDASSLNQTLDALSALGIFGALFCIMIPLSLFLLSKPYFVSKKPNKKEEINQGFIFAACFTVMLLHHGWFMMLSVIPILFSAMMTMDIPADSKKSSGKRFENLQIRYSSLLKHFTMVSSAVALFWTSHSIYSNAIYYSNESTDSLPVYLATKFNADFDFNCANLIKHRGPGAIQLAFWLRSYLQPSNDAIWDRESMAPEIKCALKALRETHPQPSLTLIKQVKDYKKIQE